MQCPQCETPLVGVSRPVPAPLFRCAECAVTFEYDANEGATPIVQSDRRAWRSLWLGMASVLLLFITGIPAVWYGVRALLGTRYRRTPRSERIAALVGTGLGLVFGIGFGGCVLLAGAIGLVTFLTYEATSDPAEIQQMVDRLVAIEVPDELRPWQGVELLNMQTHISWDDRENETDERTARLKMIHFQKTLHLNYSQLTQLLRDTSLSKQTELGTRTSQVLEWEMGGRPVKVTHQIYEVRRISNAASDDETVDYGKSTPESGGDRSGEAEMHRYYGYVAGENGAVGLCVVFLDPPGKLDQSGVERIFRSVQFREDSPPR